MATIVVGAPAALAAFSTNRGPRVSTWRGPRRVCGSDARLLEFVGRSWRGSRLAPSLSKWEATCREHVELARCVADLIIIVPATANTLARSGGFADDMVSLTAFRSDAPVVVPAMHLNMWPAPATQ